MKARDRKPLDSSGGFGVLGVVRAARNNSPVPISTHNSQFGGKPGSAQETLAALIKRYGPKRGRSIFYGMVIKRGGKVNRRGRRIDRLTPGDTTDKGKRGRTPLHKALGK